MKTSVDARPIGFAALGAFFFFGAVMASYVAITLLYPGTIFDQGWRLNPNAHLELSVLGRIMALPFTILAAALALAGVGWFRRRYWGWLLGFLLIAINLGGNVFHLFTGEILEGAVGILVAGPLAIYMARPTVRNYFRPGHDG